MRRIIDNRVSALSSEPARQPMTEIRSARRKISGSCLWLDIAGFSALTDRAQSEGAAGIEKLSDTVSSIYRQIDELVHASAGEVLFYAGDGALCFWREGGAPEVAEEVSGEAAEARFVAAVAAAHTALSLRTRLSDRDYAGYRPRLRQIVLTGRWSIRDLGVSSARAPSLFSGAALYGLAPLMRICNTDQIVLDSRSARLLTPRASVREVAAGAWALGRLQTSLPAAGVQRAAPGAEPAPAGSGLSIAAQLAHVNLMRQSLVRLPAELRRVSVLYVLVQPRCTTSLALLRRLTQCVQRVSAEEAGHLCQLVHDDKGIVFLVAFGLPGQSLGEDAARAVRSALTVAEELGEARLGAGIGLGVGSGTVFCGSDGGLGQLQYNVIGNPVIRAARFSAFGERAVLVDAETVREASRHFRFEPAGALQLKGMGLPVSAYRVVRSGRPISGPVELAAREKELQALRARLASLVESGQSGSIVIGGELGVGKTALLSQLALLAAERGIPCHATSADALDRHAAFAGFRPLWQSLFADVQGAPARLAERLAGIEGALELGALLNPLLSLGLAPSERVQQMSPSARRETRLELVSALAERELAPGCRVIAVDDAQFLDASSLEVIERLRERCPGTLWVFAERAGVVPQEPARFAGAERWSLGPLSPEGSERLVCGMAGAERVSLELRALIERTTQGNPLLTIELVHALLTAERATLRAGVLVLLQGRPGEAGVVPATLEDVLQSRFDRLSSGGRAVLRAASVLGVSFELDVLRHVLEPKLAAELFDVALGELLDDGSLVHEQTCRFKHPAMQTVIYGSLLPSDQTGLHARAAAALELGYAGNLWRVAARLAFHWQVAGDLARAASYSALAAERALEGYAHADAIHLFQQAIEQATALRGSGASETERARWSASLAQALYSESRFAEARTAYERALAWVGCPEPGDKPATLLRNALSVSVGALSDRLRLRRAAPALDAATRERHLAAMHVMHQSGALDVWESKLLSAANKALSAYQLARRVGDARESSEALADLGYMLGSTPARRYALALLQRGRDLADRTADLEARTSTRVLLGMHLTAAGRCLEADVPLGEAQTLAERLGSGLWRHRTCFARAEALLFAGRLPEAAEQFARAAELASAAEPPVEGFAHCMQALAVAAQGQLEAALTLCAGQRGAPLTRGPCLPLQRFASHGICAGLLAQAGRLPEALENALLAGELAQAENEVSVFLAGLHGHAGLVAFWLAAQQAALRGKPLAGAELQRSSQELAAALRRLTRFARLYRAAAPTLERLRGDVQARAGRGHLARRRYERSAQSARAMGQNHALELARRALAERRS